MGNLKRTETDPPNCVPLLEGNIPIKGAANEVAAKIIVGWTSQNEIAKQLCMALGSDQVLLGKIMNLGEDPDLVFTLGTPQTVGGSNTVHVPFKVFASSGT